MIDSGEGSEWGNVVDFFEKTRKYHRMTAYGVDYWVEDEFLDTFDFMLSQGAPKDHYDRSWAQVPVDRE